MLLKRHAGSREHCTVDTVAEEDVRKMVGESGDKVTWLEIRMYVESDRQQEIIPIT